MNRRIPSIDIFRPVENITAEDAIYIEADTLRRSPDSENEKVHKLFEENIILMPLQAIIVNRAELMRLQRRTGNGQVDEDHIQELGTYIRSVMPSFSYKPLTVPTLPAEIYEDDGSYKANRNPIKTLAIARSIEVVQERILAKQAIHAFYGIDEVTSGTWLDDKYMASVRLMRSRKTIGAKVMRRVNKALDQKARLLPEETRLGPLDLRFSH